MKYNRLTPEQEDRALGYLRSLAGMHADITALVAEVDKLDDYEQRMLRVWEDEFPTGDRWPDWKDRVLSWAYDTIPGLDYKRPIDLMATPEGRDAVKLELQRIAAGNLG